MPINFDTEDLMTDTYENREKIEHLAELAQGPLSALTDALEDEMGAAFADDDLPRLAKIAWDYGILVAAVTDIQMHLLVS